MCNFTLYIAQKKRDERDEEDILSPCDLLLLSGRLVCDEALLTGESIPQVKEGIDMLDQTHILNLKEHQVAVISGRDTNQYIDIANINIDNNIVFCQGAISISIL